MPSNSDTMKRAAEMLGVDEDEVGTRLERLPMDEVIDVLDAIQAGHTDRVKEMLGDGVDENDHTHDEAEAAGQPEPTEADEDEDAETRISPLFMKSAQSAKTRKRAARAMDEDDETPHEPNVGDEVRVGDDEGIVKFKNGPNDTTGVMIDGETTMVKDHTIRSNEGVNEGAIGLSGMPDLRRMRELAGLTPPSAEGAEFAAVDMTNRMNAAEGPLSPGSFAVEIEPCPEPTCDGDMAAVVPTTPAAPPTDAEGGLTAIMGAFDEIENILPGIVLNDVKQVRNRINTMLAKLNESTDGRRRKP